MAEYITEEYVRGILRPRKSDTHKGDYGRILIYAGSVEMAGAAVLAARGALKSGAGLVYMCIPKEMFHILQIAVPEAVCVERKYSIDLEKYDSIVFGPGLGINNSDRDMLVHILESYSGTVVIDADGINLISRFKLYDELRASNADIVITPHGGEAARFLGSMPEERHDAAKALHEKSGATAVLKGHETIVEGEKTLVNTTGNPGMATAGSGDVLSGIIGSLAGQGYSGFEAAAIGVYLHGYAGDMAAEREGQWGITASDIAGCVSLAIKDMLGE